jgi:aminoglycoside phosphotransferase (APT) family kinase protein
LHGGNILVNDNRISAVIDFGIAGLGDPACDIAVAWTLLDSETRKLFRSVTGIDDATWERSKGWPLRGVVAIPYYKETNPTLVNIAIRSINEVLRDSV